MPTLKFSDWWYGSGPDRLICGSRKEAISCAQEAANDSGEPCPWQGPNDAGWCDPR